MKVVIDISQLHSAALKRGVGFYTLNLFQALTDLKDSHQYFLKKDKDKKNKADLIHYPYFDPFFLTSPLKNARTVVTIHDLTPLKFPQHFPSGIRGKVKWQIQKRLVKQVRAILTDSLNSKKDIIDIIGFSKDKVHPIPLAVGKEFQPIYKKDKNKFLLKVREKYHLSSDFILYVGDLNWNKNVIGLIKAFGQIKDKNKNLKLVLVGSAFKNDQLIELRKIKELIKKLKLEKEVIFLGFIPTKELAVVYNLAVLYVQPSFYEGFGFPVLEAMSCGCPVLCSNQASLPEVGGQAVEYFNPHKIGELGKKLETLLKNKKRLVQLVSQGLKQAEKFSWQKTALATRGVYEKAIKEI